MIIFSVSKMIQGKVATKGFKKVTCSTEDAGQYLSDYSISVGIFEGEHRRNEHVIECGNVVLIDIDNKDSVIDRATLDKKLDRYEHLIGESMSSSDELRKYHALVEIDQPMPTCKTEFARWYAAIVQYLGLEDYVDFGFKVMSSQMAPTGKSVDSHKGRALKVQWALEAYKEPDYEGSSSGLAGKLKEGVEFNTELGVLTVSEVIKTVDEGKLGCKCINGYDHGSRYPAFLALRDDGDVQYFCTGARCGGKTWLLPDEPMKSLEVETTTDVKDLSGELFDLDPKDFVTVDESALYEPRASAQVRVSSIAKIAVRMLKKVKTVRLHDEIYSFNGVQWVVTFKTENDAIRFAIKVCEGLGCMTEAGNIHALESIIRFILKSIKAPSKLPKRNLLNLQNCMIEVSKRGAKTYKHTPAAYMTHTLPYKYDPAAKAPVWNGLVKKIMCDDKELIKAFQEAIGYLFLADLNLEKVICFIGDGANGKSTVNTVIKMLLGSSGYSAAPLSVLCKDNSDGLYARATVDGKLVNITNELTPVDLKSETFKDIVSGADIQARHIYGKPFYVSRMPKQLVSMNTTKQLIKESTHGFIRRLNLYPFGYTVKEMDKDPDLMEKLGEELSGIFNWVLVGAKRVMRTQRLATAEAMKTLLDKTIMENNSVKFFITEMVDSGINFNALTPVQRTQKVVPGAEIYEDYHVFCSENGLKPFGKLNFLAEYERFFAPRIETSTSVEGQIIKLKGFFYPKRLWH